jgi:hypothetical protein
LRSFLLATGFGIAGTISAWGQDVAADPVALVRRAVEHRAAAEKAHQPMRYLLRREDDERETVKEIVETRDGDVAKLVELNGKPLTPEQEQGERQRLEALLAHPQWQEKRRRSEVGDQKRVSDLLALLPDGLVYQLQGTTVCGAVECWRLSFSPKSGWNPPTMEAEVLRAVTGEMLIDKRQEQLVRLDARFIQDASFGFGILARIEKGGTARLEQSDVGHGDWELTSLDVDLRGKALMVKSIEVKLKERTSDYALVPAMGYREAVKFLESAAGVVR